LFVEDNTFILNTGDFNNGIDGNWGCRYVVRFNEFRGSRVEFHSLQSDNARGCRVLEAYNNDFNSNGVPPNYRPFLMRAGTGKIFHNTYDGSMTIDDVIIDNDRSHECSIANANQCGSGGQNQVPTFGMCGWQASSGGEQVNGNSFVDGNIAGRRGYPC